MTAQHTVEVLPALIPTTIVEYSKTAAGLAELRAKYEGALYDCTTKDGLALATAGRAELRSLRVNLEKKREELKKPHLERGRAIDGEAKTLTAAISALEDPIDAQIKAVEAVKAAEKEAAAKAERERLAAIAKRIDAIQRLPLSIIGKSADQIDEARLALSALDFSDMEPADRQLANDARAASLATMTAAHDAAAKAEDEAMRLLGERQELERRRAEQEAELAEQRRLADEAQRAERERDNLARAEADAAAKAARDKAEAEHRAQMEAEQAERDRVRAIEDAARAAEDARIEQERAEARARIQAEQEALDRRAAELHAEEIERARVEAEAEQARQAEAEAAAIASASLVDAAKDALAMLADLDQEETLTFRTLQAAIKRAEESAS